MQKPHAITAATTSRKTAAPARAATGPAPAAEEVSSNEFSPEFALSSDLQRVLAGPRALNPNVIRRLQHTIGNKSVQRLLQGQRPVTPVQPSVIQRFRDTYTSQAGQTWEQIARMHGFLSSTITPKMQSFLDSNGIAMSDLTKVIPTGKIVKLPKNIRAVPTSTATTGTSGTTGTTGTTGTSGTTGTTATTSGPPPIPGQAELGTALSAVGNFLEWAVKKPGDKYAFELGFRIPVGGGVFLGIKMSGEAERDDADPTTNVAPLKLDAKLGVDGKASYNFLYYGQVDFGGSFSRNIKAESKRGGTGAMEALSFALYRSVQETSYLPGRIMNWIWGSDREGWSARTAGRIADADDKAFIGWAGGLSGGTKSSRTIKGTETSEMGVELAVTTGTEYSQDSITTKGEGVGTGGYRGKTTSGWFSTMEESLGETKNTYEATLKAQILGNEASVKVAKEGDEWGVEVGANIGLYSKIPGESASEKASSVYDGVSSAVSSIGGKMAEWIKYVSQSVKLSKTAIRNAKAITGGSLPGKDQFALVLYQGATSSGSSSSGPLMIGSGETPPLPELAGASMDAPNTFEMPKEGWYNADEGKYEQDAKLVLVHKRNLSKGESSYGLDINFEAGFDSSALTIKGARTKRLLKW